MNAKSLIWSTAACLVVPAITAASGPAQVSFENGLLTVICTEAPLGEVFDRIRAATGMELILEEPVKTIPLTAQIQAEPVHFTIERLLEGSGVNYAMSFDYRNWQRVSKIFIGSGGESPATPTAQAGARMPVRRRPSRMAPVDAQDEMMEDPEQFEEPVEPPLEEEPPPEDVEGGMAVEDPSDTEPPPTSDFLPPPPRYPRSSFTPGLESNPFGQVNPPRGQQQPETMTEEEGGQAPPAYYPFLDPFGRPIPIPPEARQQQQQQKKQEERKN